MARGNFWKKQEVTILISSLDSGKTTKEIQKLLPNRSLISIRDKAFRMKKNKNRKIDECILLYQKGLPLADIAIKTGFNLKTVESKIYQHVGANRKKKNEK